MFSIKHLDLFKSEKLQKFRPRYLETKTLESRTSYQIRTSEYRTVLEWNSHCDGRGISPFHPLRVFPISGMFEIFWRRSSLGDNAEEASRKMLSWQTAAIWAGARGLDEGVLSRLFVPCMSCTWWTGAPSGGRWWTGADACMTCMVPRVLIIRLEQPRVNLLGLPLSATKAFPAKLPRHRHYATNVDGSQGKNEKLKCVVNSNLAYKPRNSLFWTS